MNRICSRGIPRSGEAVPEFLVDTPPPRLRRAEVSENDLKTTRRRMVLTVRPAVDAVTVPGPDLGDLVGCGVDLRGFQGAPADEAQIEGGLPSLAGDLQ
jgi:hypothetical protein